jgi:hypothetical protein
MLVDTGYLLENCSPRSCLVVKAMDGDRTFQRSAMCNYPKRRNYVRDGATKFFSKCSPPGFFRAGEASSAGLQLALL